MKSNNTALVATTLMALAGVVLTAPVPQVFPKLTPAEIGKFPKGFTYDPTFNYDPTRTQIHKTTVNNGNGDGNSGGKITQNKNSGNGDQTQNNHGNGDGNSGSKITSNQHSENGDQNNHGDGDGNSGGKIASTKNSGNGGNGIQNQKIQNNAPKGSPSYSKSPNRRRGTTRITGDGDGNSGHAEAEINENDDNQSHNTQIQNHLDSHNSQVETSFGLFRRGKTVISGDGDGNSGHAKVEINKNDNNDSGNTNVLNHLDSHNIQSDTSFGLFRRGGKHITVSGDGDGNKGHSEVEINKNDNNNSDNTLIHNHLDSHNTQSDTSFGLFRRGGKHITVSGDGDGNKGYSEVEINKNDNNHSDNTVIQNHLDSHNVDINSGLDLPIPF